MDNYTMVSLAILGTFIILLLNKLQSLESRLESLKRKVNQNHEHNEKYNAEQNEKLEELSEEFESVKTRLRVKPQK